MQIDKTKIINEAKNRRILYKGGKMKEHLYSEDDFKMDGILIEHFENKDGHNQ